MTIQEAINAAWEHFRAGRLDEMESLCAAVLKRDPGNVDALNALGVLAGTRKQHDLAIELLLRAVAEAPQAGKLHHNLAHALASQRRYDEAIASFRRAIALENFAASYNDMGNALKDAGRVPEAIEAYRASVELEPSHRVHSNLLYAMHYVSNSPAELLAAHQDWGRRYAANLSRTTNHRNDRSPDRRLRIGYVSPDFASHPVGRFFAPLLASHDRANFEIVCYSDVTSGDEMTQELRQQTNIWRDTGRLDDAQLAQSIEADQIDVLVDLTLHSSGNRLLVFARKPAPVQASYLGYASTTGLTAIDYRFTDRYLDPRDDEQPYTERSIPLRSYWCYAPSAIAPQVTPLPAPRTGHVTFGSLNNFAKVSAAALALWAEVLDAVRDARLVLYCPAGAHRARVLDALHVPPQRVEFLEWQNFDRYFAAYQRIDVALDPMPFNGATTTCDALWMGVPVVSLSGPTAVGRAGASLLSNVGMPELIAHTPQDYVRIARELSADLPRLSQLRAELRERMRQSPLCDAAGFAHDVEAAYRMMWRRWCKV